MLIGIAVFIMAICLDMPLWATVSVASLGGLHFVVSFVKVMLRLSDLSDDD